MKRFTIGILAAAAVLAAMLHRAEIGDVVGRLTGVGLGSLGVALLLKLAAMWLKARRWAVSLRCGTGPFAGRRMFGACMIGFAGNVLLPARLGEVARILVVSRHNRIPKSRAASSIGVTQVLDLLVLAALMLAVSVTFSSASPVVRQTTTGVLTAAGAGLAAVLLIMQCRHDAVRVRIASVFRSWSSRLVRFRGVANGLIEGLAGLADGRAAAIMLGQTVLVWCLETAAMCSALSAFGIQPDVMVAALLVVTLNLSFAVPLTPGNIGTHQLISVLILALFGIERAAALSFSIGYQGAVHLMIVLIGGAFFCREGLSLDALRREAGERQGASEAEAEDSPAPTTDGDHAATPRGADHGECAVS